MPPAKKQRKKGSKPGNTKGKALKQPFRIQDLSMDVILEILKYLDPRELVNLAETSKALRAILLNKSFARSLWRDALARKSSHLTKVTYMIEAEIARVAYKDRCQHCNTVKTNRPYWGFGARYCDSCFDRFTMRTLPARLKRLVEPYIINDLFLTEWRTEAGQNYSKLQTDAFVDKLESVESEAERKKAIGIQRDLKRTIKNHAWIFQDWQIGERMAEGERIRRNLKEEENLRALRFEQVTGKLKGLGYTDEISRMGIEQVRELKEIKLIKLPKTLTPADWRKIQPSVIEFMEKVREDQVQQDNLPIFERAFRDLLDVFSDLRSKSNTNCDKLYPQIQDFCFIPEVRLAMDVEPEALPSRRMLEERLTLLFPDLISAWKSERVSLFSKSIKQKLGSPNEVNAFELVCAQMKCSLCSETARYPDFLSHRCFYTRSNRMKPWESYEARVRHSFNHGPARVSFKFDKKALERCGEVVKLLGKDPSTATLKEMDKLKIGLVCHWCRGKNQVAMPWRQAFGHFTSQHLHLKGAVGESSAEVVELEK